MPPGSPLRVLIADDHAVVREGLLAMISHEADMEVVAEARNGREAICRFREYLPDLALLDVMMPQISGIEATRTICREFPHARIILLTLSDAEENVYQGLKAGAKSYLFKDIEHPALLQALREVVAGKPVLSPEVITKFAHRIQAPELTPREIEVLRCIVSGMSNAEIGNALFITEGTVEAHVNNLLSKMAVSDRTQAAVTAVRRGLIPL